MTAAVPAVPAAPAPPAPAASGRIRQIAVTVRDLDAAVAFYQGALGLPLLFTAPPGLAFLDCAGTRLMLARPEGEHRPAGGTVLYFAVADAAAAQAAVVARGGRAEGEAHRVARMGDHDLWLAFVRDPDDHLVGLMAEMPPAAD